MQASFPTLHSSSSTSPSSSTLQRSLFSPSRCPTMDRQRGERGPVVVVYTWVRQRSVKAKMALGILTTLLSLAALWILICDHSHFFVASEAVHVAGIIVLIYKLTRQKMCSRLSLNFQELASIFSTVRLYCCVVIEKFLWDFAVYLGSLSALPQL